jgi:hypothetical protein
MPRWHCIESDRFFTGRRISGTPAPAAGVFKNESRLAEVVMRSSM